MLRAYLRGSNCCPINCPYYAWGGGGDYAYEWCKHPLAGSTLEPDDFADWLALCPISLKPIWFGHIVERQEVGE